MCLIAGMVTVWLAVPCRSSEQVTRILPLGDSVTMGVEYQQSYRYRLWVKMLGSGIPFDLVGTMSWNYSGQATYPDYAGHSFDRDHEGHAGWRAQDLLDGCMAEEPCPTKNEGYLGLWLGEYTPDIVLLHIGTNDIYQRAPQSTTVASINTMISVLRGDNPEVIILLATLIPMRGTEREIKIRALNEAIVGIASARTTLQSPVYLVDQFSGFSNTLDTYDGTHPNASGEEKMAQQWYVAILGALQNRNEPPVADAGRDRWASAYRVEVNLAGTASDDGGPAPLATLWSQLAGPSATIAQPLARVSAVTLPSIGDYQFQFTVWDGALLTNDTVRVHMQPYSCPRLHLESGGRVVFEAEKMRSRSQGQGALAFTYWDQATDRPGYSGSAAMAAYPTVTSYANTKDGLGGCHMDYWIEFATPGTYFAWVRMLGPAGNANSVHLGLDGIPATFGYQGMEEDTGTWQWVGTVSSQRVAIQVDVPGRHKVDLWMREDGTYVDKLVLARDRHFAPAGLGPAVSDSRQVCDFDEDGMDDTWELAHWDGLEMDGSDNLDGDPYLNREEYVAGTDPEDAQSYPVIAAILPPGSDGIAFLSARDRMYQLEYSDPNADPDAWRPVGPEMVGTGYTLVLSDPSPTPSRTYRFRVRSGSL